MSAALRASRPSPETTLLVRHPQAQATESIGGYILRLSEENGYQTCRSLFEALGIHHNEWKSCGRNVAALAAATNQDIQSLLSISYSDLDHTSQFYLLGHPVRPQQLHCLRPSICPECIQALGFIEAHWDLANMTACPLHRLPAITFCPECNAPLSLCRPGLLTCSCGAQLVRRDYEPISSAVATLLNLIRTKVLRLPDKEANPAELPLQHLHSIPLKHLLQLIDVLGTEKRSALTSLGHTSTPTVTECAASVLSQWPNGLYALLTDLSVGYNPEFVCLAWRGPFASLYRRLFHGTNGSLRDYSSFIKPFIIEFALARWNSSVIDARFMPYVTPTLRSRFAGVSDLAHEQGISKGRAAELTRKGLFPHRVLQSANGKKRIVICTEKLLAGLQQTTECMSAKEASSIVGLPERLLKACRKSGLFQVTSGLEYHMYYTGDIRAFQDRFDALAKARVDHDSSPRVSINDALIATNYSVDVQLSVLKGILAGDINISGDSARGFGHLTLRRDDLDNTIKSVSPWYSDTVTAKQAYCILGNCYCRLRFMVQEGLLDVVPTPLGIRVTGDSLRRFDGQFISLAAISRNLHRHAVLLRHICEAHKIAMLFAGPNHTAPFIRRDDVIRVQDAANVSPVALQRMRKDNTRHQAVETADNGLHPTTVSISRASAAQLIVCGVSVIPLLIKRGMLQHGRDLRTTSVDRKSLETFISSYISLRDLSKMLACSKGHLRRVCDRNRITVESISPSTECFPLVKRVDVPVISAALNHERKLRAT